LSLGLGALVLVGCATSDVFTRSLSAQRQGVELYNDGSYAEAAGAFRNASRQNPRDYKNYYYLGACYEQMGKFHQAISSYRTARERINVSMAGKDDDEFRQRIINGMARAVARSDQRDLETDALVREAEQKGGGENWYLVAKVYSFRGDPDSAIDAYNRAALLAPKNFVIQKDYGLYLQQVGQQQRATAPLRKAYTLNPSDPQVNDALRQAGIVPGPSLKPQSALVEPPLPKGPIPELELKFGSSKSSSASSGQQQQPTQRTVEAPRD
jgi:tetratricopeptide (TPR) repeat protein